MVRRRLRTSEYSEAARDALADAVVAAREVAGFTSRDALAEAAGVSVRMIDYLELGEPRVGQKVLHAVARQLPGWTIDTPRAVLEGGSEPPIPAVPIDPARLAVRELADCITVGKDLGPLAKYWAGRLSDPDDIWGLIDEARKLSEEEARQSIEEGAERDVPRRHA